MSRCEAYISALKFYWRKAMIDQGFGPRAAWQIARKKAADYAFNVKSFNLNTLDI